jgi:predicted O-methyltransferase YrrM
VEQTPWFRIDAYIEAVYGLEDPVLEHARSGGLPAAEVSPAQGAFLHVLAQAVRARSILELGTLGGYSTIWLARAVPADGRLVTLEADPAQAEIARTNVERAGFGGVVDIRVGPALETLPDVDGPFDFVFIDADKEHNPEYLDWALRLSRPGTLIVADNVVRGGAIVDAESKDPRVRGVRRFHELLAAEPRVVATAIQTVGVKGYDGFAIALVTR